MATYTFDLHCSGCEAVLGSVEKDVDVAPDMWGLCDTCSAARAAAPEPTPEPEPEVEV